VRDRAIRAYRVDGKRHAHNRTAADLQAVAGRFNELSKAESVGQSGLVAEAVQRIWRAESTGAEIQHDLLVTALLQTKLTIDNV
jgi:hypothetical protein